MAIILEGPDAAGKTTLGRTLQRDFDMRLIVSGGAPKTEFEVMQYCAMQLSHCSYPNTVIDRVTPISHPIYNPKYVGHPRIVEYLKLMVASDVVIVYCRPPNEALMRPEKHVWKDYDTEDHKKRVLDNQMAFIMKYDEVFAKIPHLTYDYTQAESEAMRYLVLKLGQSSKSERAFDDLLIMAGENGKR